MLFTLCVTVAFSPFWISVSPETAVWNEVAKLWPAEIIPVRNDRLAGSADSFEMLVKNADI